MKRRLSGCASQGFTLVELMVVVSIAAIMAFMGVPALQGMLNEFRQRSAAALLVSDLNQARTEAIKRNSRVLMCVRNSAGTGCAASTNWLAGWVICTDSQASATCDATSPNSPNPMAVRSALDAGLTLSVTDASAAGVSVIRFNANATQGADSSTASFRLSGNWDGATTNVITVAATGHIMKR